MKQLLVILTLTLLFFGCSDDPTGSNDTTGENTFVSNDFEEKDTYFSFTANEGDSLEPASWDIKFTHIPFYAYSGCDLVMTIKEPVIMLGEGASASVVAATSLDDVTTLPAADSFKEDVDKVAVIGGSFLDENNDYTMDVYAVKTCSGNFALVQFVDASYDFMQHQLYDIKIVVKYNADGSRDFTATEADTIIVPNAYNEKQYYSFFNNGIVTEDDAFDMFVEGYKFYLGDGAMAKNLNIQDMQSISTITDDEWDLDAPGTVTYDWYIYDPATHSVTPRDYVYVVHTANDEYYAFKIVSIYDNQADYGTFTIDWKKL